MKCLNNPTVAKIIPGFCQTLNGLVLVVYISPQQIHLLEIVSYNDYCLFPVRNSLFIELSIYVSEILKWQLFKEL